MIVLKYIRENMHNIVLRSLLLSVFAGEGFLYAEDCLTKSYIAAIGKNKTEIDPDRKEDLDYSSCIDLMCCCSSQIRDLFSEKTEKMTHQRVNPAVDNLIMALKNQRKASDIKIEKLVHLKYVNAIYSFYDKDGATMKNEKLTMPSEDGCEDVITFKTPDISRKGVYREGLLKEILALVNAWEKSDKMIENKNMIKMLK